MLHICSLFGGSWLVVSETIYRHVVFLYEHRNVELSGGDHTIELFDLKMIITLQLKVVSRFSDLIDVVKFLLDGRGHES